MRSLAKNVYCVHTILFKSNFHLIKNIIAASQQQVLYYNVRRLKAANSHRTTDTTIKSKAHACLWYGFGKY